MRTIVLTLVVILSCTVSAQNFTKGDYVYHQNILKRLWTEQDFKQIQSKVDSMQQVFDSRIDSMQPYVDKTSPLLSTTYSGSKSELERTYDRHFEDADLEQARQILVSRYKTTETEELYRLFNQLKQDYTDKLYLYKAYKGTMIQYSQLSAKLTKLKTVKADLDDIRNILQAEINRQQADSLPKSGVYRTKKSVLIEGDDVITVTAPYKTVEGFRVFNGQCILKRVRNQYTNATGTHFKEYTYNVTIILTVVDGTVKAEKYSGTMYWWAPNQQARNISGTYRQKQQAMDNAKPVIISTRHIRKYEDFGYHGDLAKEMLELLQTESFTESDENSVIYAYLSSVPSVRKQIIEQFQKRYRTYKSAILIDFSEIR